MPRDKRTKKIMSSFVRFNFRKCARFFVMFESSVPAHAAVCCNGIIGSSLAIQPNFPGLSAHASWNLSKSKLEIDALHKNSNYPRGSSHNSPPSIAQHALQHPRPIWTLSTAWIGILRRKKFSNFECNGTVPARVWHCTSTVEFCEGKAGLHAPISCALRIRNASCFVPGKRIRKVLHFHSLKSCSA